MSRSRSGATIRSSSATAVSASCISSLPSQTPRRKPAGRMQKFFTVNIDGGARGNPGPAGWGVVVAAPEGEVVAELHGAIRHATNNVAEYSGLIAALDWCAGQGASAVHVKSDSLLLVQQMRGIYKVKNEGLKSLYGQARLLAH